MEVFAHRGSSWEHPENTLEAFEAALADGATGIETDLHLTRDGLIVLAHDPDLRRTAGDPRRISDLTGREVRQVRVAGRHPVPLLQDLLDLVGGQVRVNLEIKAPGVAGVLTRCLAGCAGEVLVTSALTTELEVMNQVLPSVPTGPVLERLGKKARGYLARHPHRAVSLSKRGFSAEDVDFCHAHGAEILVWVVNDPARVLDLRAAGVDGVFTDRPRPILSALRAP